MRLLSIICRIFACFYCVAFASFSLVAAVGSTGNGELDAVLKNNTVDRNFIKGKANQITYNGLTFKLDGNGLFYREDNQGVKHPLDIYVNPEKLPQKEFIISDPKAPAAGLPSNPLFLTNTTDEQQNILDDIASVQRQFGMNAMKRDNPECYYAIAAKRLGPANLGERLIALERPENARPLAFDSDEDWDAFKTDLKNLLKAFKSPQSYIAIVGTSTTFFSENPRKGKNAPLFETAPACLERFNDPKASADVYTFDTPGYDKSDIDIQLFIPKLSDLCEKGRAPGNNGKREVYAENTLDQCLRISPEKEVRDLVSPVHMGNYESLLKAMVPEKAIGKFYEKWGTKLKGRDLNFSVHIRPDQRKAPMTQQNKVDFEDGPYSKGRFVIPVN